MSYFHSFVLQDENWKDVKIMRVLPSGEDPWGILSPIKETFWGHLINVVSGEDYSHALHGWLTPLMQVLETNPLRRIKSQDRETKACRLKTLKRCSMASEKCHPGKDVPECYVAPVEGDPYPLSEVVLAINNGYYVVVVVGQEFSFK